MNAEVGNERREEVPDHAPSLPGPANGSNRHFGTFALVDKAFGRQVEGMSMPINALRKPGAKMSLKEALERAEKLKRMAASSNPHEAASAAARLNAFDIHAARAPQPQGSTHATASPRTQRFEDEPSTHRVDVLDEWPVIPYKELGELEVVQLPEHSSVNWDVLHAELLERAQRIDADAVIHIRIKGTIRQKILTGTALKYLTPQEILDVQAANKLEDDEKAYREAQKERRDEDWAPPVG